MTERKLATIREIAEIIPIPGADRIVQYRIDGWKVVDQKDRYKVGDLVIYCEVDSWIPTDIAPFLSKGKEPKEYLGIKGEKLRTIRLKKALSQGLLLPLPILGISETLGNDVTSDLGIVKWEPPAPVFSNARGSFPEFLVKTDQERVQNCWNDIPKNETFEVTEKLEGSSFTAYFNDGVFGVCSRNLELKLDEDSVWKRVSEKYDLESKLKNLGRNIAIQGEIVGPNIQGNIYNLSDVELYVFDVFNIDTQQYFMPYDSRYFADFFNLNYAPVISTGTKITSSLEDVIASADGNSTLEPTNREGIVFKSEMSNFSFKAISNTYLEKQD